MHVEWDPQAAVTPPGQQPFFTEFGPLLVDENLASGAPDIFLQNGIDGDRLTEWPCKT